MIQSSSIPFYLQMIALVRNAIALLDDQGREEVLQFILNQQNADGGFSDRGGRSHLYYSLFGMLILLGIKGRGQVTGGRGANLKLVEESILKLKQFTEGQKISQVPGFIERCCLALLQKELKARKFSNIRSLWSLGRSFMKERNSINLSYRGFVLLLTLEAVSSFLPS